MIENVNKAFKLFAFIDKQNACFLRILHVPRVKRPRKQFKDFVGVFNLKFSKKHNAAVSQLSINEFQKISLQPSKLMPILPYKYCHSFNTCRSLTL